MPERIGVYVCWCGGNISDVVNVKEVAKHAAGVPEVVVAKDVMFACSDEGQRTMVEDIKNLKLDGVVVASCSPVLHEQTFRRVAERAGLNKYLYVQVNIREQDSWAHAHDKKGATEKAEELVGMGIEKLARATPLNPIRVELSSKVLVVGGGVSGLTTALELARKGIHVTLVDRDRYLGGFVRRLPDVNPVHRPGKDVVADLYRRVTGTGNVDILSGTDLIEVSGSIGHFRARFRERSAHIRHDADREQLARAERECPVEVDNEEDFGFTRRKAIVLPAGRLPDTPYIDMEHCIKCGVCQRLFGEGVSFDDSDVEFEEEFSMVVQSTGFQPYLPERGEFGYVETRRVLTLPEFLRLADTSGKTLVFNGRQVRDVAFVYCVGSRQTETGGPNTYCSRYCCTSTLNTDSYIKKKFGSSINSFHFYRDIRAYGLYETMYERVSREKGLFIRYDPASPPSVTAEGERVKLVTKDSLTAGRDIEVSVDLVVLVTGMIPSEDGKKLSAALKVSSSKDGFVQELHPKLRPVETTVGGVLVGGTAQGPKDSHESMISGAAAAAKASTLLMKGYTELEPYVVTVSEQKCNGCTQCVTECPAGAISMVEMEGRQVASVNVAMCKGCGACAAICEPEALQLIGYTYPQLRAMVSFSPQPLGAQSK